MSSVAYELNGTSGYTIERDVPIPTRSNRTPKERKPREYRYPFRAMSVGESVLIHDAQLKTIASAVQNVKKLLSGSKWTVRRQDDGVRVWRTA